MPWLRPMQTVSLCSSARTFSAASRRSTSAMMQIGRTHQLHIEARIQHVRRRHALMHEPRFGTDMLGKMRQERDDVVLGHPLDLVDPFDIEGCSRALLPDDPRRPLSARRRDPPSPRQHEPRSRTRCENASQAPRSEPSRDGNSAGSWGCLVVAHLQAWPSRAGRSRNERKAAPAGDRRIGDVRLRTEDFEPR